MTKNEVNNKIEVNTVIDDMSIDINFQDKCCILGNESGTGKTYVLKILNLELAGKREFKYINFMNYYSNLTFEFHDVWILDNCDLYLTNDDLKKIVANSNIVIACVRNYDTLTGIECHRYGVEFKNGSLRTFRR